MIRTFEACVRLPDGRFRSAFQENAVYFKYGNVIVLCPKGSALDSEGWEHDAEWAADHTDTDQLTYIELEADE